MFFASRVLLAKSRTTFQCGTLQPHLLRSSDVLNLSSVKSAPVQVKNFKAFRIRFYRSDPNDYKTLRGFPPNTHGFLYFHHEQGTPLSSAEVRFRVFEPSVLPVTPDAPLDFTKGKDLISPRFEPWSISLFQLAEPRYQPIKSLLLSEGVVDETLLHRMGESMIPNLTTKTRLRRLAAEGLVPTMPHKTIHYFDQPFVVNLARASQMLGLWDGQTLTVANFAWFKGWNLHTGHLLVRFEHDRRRLNARNPSDNDRVVIRILKILQPVRVTKPTPRDLERMSFVDQNYPEYFPCEGELLHSRWIDHNQDQQTTPIVIDLKRYPWTVLKQLKPASAP